MNESLYENSRDFLTLLFEGMNPMVKPIVMTSADGKHSTYACGECGKVYGEQNKDLVEGCCAKRSCGNCGKETPRFVDKCYDCREQERLQAAEIVENEHGFYIGDKFYDEVEDLEGVYLPGHAPDRAWAAYQEPVKLLDLDDELYHLIEQMGYSTEECEPLDFWDGVEELRKAVDQFNDLNRKKTVLQESMKVVLIPAPYSDTEPADVSA